jgi:hypothetical protein
VGRRRPPPSGWDRHRGSLRSVGCESEEREASESLVLMIRQDVDTLNRPGRHIRFSGSGIHSMIAIQAHPAGDPSPSTTKGRCVRRCSVVQSPKSTRKSARISGFMLINRSPDPSQSRQLVGVGGVGQASRGGSSGSPITSTNVHRRPQLAGDKASHRRPSHCARKSFTFSISPGEDGGCAVLLLLGRDGHEAVA